MFEPVRAKLILNEISFKKLFLVKIGFKVMLYIFRCLYSKSKLIIKI